MNISRRSFLWSSTALVVLAALPLPLSKPEKVIGETVFAGDILVFENGRYMRARSDMSRNPLIGIAAQSMRAGTRIEIQRNGWAFAA